MIPSIARQKISIIHNCIQQIKITTDLKPDSLDNQLIQDAFVLNVQRSVQATIDLAAWVCKEKKLGIPDTYRRNFELLFENKIIDEDTFNSMKSMCGFRNIAIHEYRKINKAILKSILSRHLIDLENFYKMILKHFEA